jgi:hypothetical protein
VKLLHCSDAMIGMAFPHAYEKADKLRQYRMDALKSAISLARRERAEAIIFAGNTLADNRISPNQLKELSATLSGSSIPVYILPGQTDPYTPDSPFRLQPGLFKPPIHILTDARPLNVQGSALRLYPFPVRSRNNNAWLPPDDWIPPRSETAEIRVGVACLPYPDRAYGLQQVHARHLDYVAAGGSLVSAGTGSVRWSGTLEPATFGAPPGHALAVTIHRPGGNPEVQPISTSRLTWLDWTRAVDRVQPLTAELEAVKNPNSVLLRLTLNGALELDAVTELREATERLRARFFHLQVMNNVLLATAEEEPFQNPLLRAMANKLRILASQPAEAAAESSAAIALQALVHLTRIVNGLNEEDLL